MSDRCYCFGTLMGNALRCYRAGVSGAPGHKGPDTLLTSFAVILPVHLGTHELRFFETSFSRAQDSWPFPGVDRATFARLAKEHVARQPLPPAPPGFDPFAETPRAKLASAWAEASERDRRDLVARATGRAAA